MEVVGEEGLEHPHLRHRPDLGRPASRGARPVRFRERTVELAGEELQSVEQNETAAVLLDVIDVEAGLAVEELAGEAQPAPGPGFEHGAIENAVAAAAVGLAQIAQQEGLAEKRR